MKTTIATMALCFGFIYANAQHLKEAEVPANVKDSFAKKYPGSKVKVWEKEEAEFEAEFDLNKAKDRAHILEGLSMALDKIDLIIKTIRASKDKDEAKENLISKFKNGFLKRRVQADNVRTEIDKSPYPVVVCGDFNDVPNSYAYETIGHDLQDAFVVKGAGMGRTFSGISPTLRIDNIFIDKRYTISQFKLIPKKLSDHFPLFADINLQIKAPK